MDLPLKDLQAAAEARDSYAQAFLALVYAHGDKGADISISNASKWAALSSQANHWLGHFALGFLARFRADGWRRPTLAVIISSLFGIAMEE